MIYDQPYDYFIAFHAIACVYNKIVKQANSASNPEATQKIISICWSSYDIKRKMVTKECQYLIKPTEFTSMPQETAKSLRITTEDLITKGITLSEALQNFNKAMFTDYVCNNLSFCIVTKDDAILTKLLPNDCREACIKLPNHFFTYFNIQKEILAYYGITDSSYSLMDHFPLMKLEESPSKTLSQVEVKNIITLLDHLVSKGYRFEDPICLNPQHQVISSEKKSATTTAPLNSQQTGPMIQSSQGLEKKWFIRLRGLPYSAREPDIIDFLKRVKIFSIDNIAILYNTDGRPSGEAYISCSNETEFNGCLSLNLTNLENRYIEVFQASEHEFKMAKSSHFSQKSKYGFREHLDYSQLLSDTVGILRMRGLPYSCDEDDIRRFFDEYVILKDGIVRPTSYGKVSGECYVVFNTKEEALKAMSKDKQNIGTRFIELFISDTQELEYILYNSSKKTKQYGQREGKIADEDRRKTLKMSGLPFKVTKVDVIKFFEGFQVREDNIHFTQNNDGRFSGEAFVMFADEGEARRALKTKNLKYVGNRYVELFELK